MLTDAAIAALRAGGKQPFSFFPPVRGFPENRWRFHDATRIEFGAENAASGDVIWFPRSTVSYMTLEENAVTITLRKELECSGGAVWPVHDALLEPGDVPPRPPAAAEEETGMAAEEEPDAAAAAARPPGVTGVRPRARQLPWWKNEPFLLVLVSVCGAAAVFTLALLLAGAWLRPSQATDSAPISDPLLFTLTRDDAHPDVLRKLGAPEGDRWLSLEGGELPQRALLYPSRDYAVVLLGVGGPRTYGQEPRYIGAIRLSDGAVVASVSLAHDSRTDALLRIAARQLRGAR